LADPSPIPSIRSPQFAIFEWKEFRSAGLREAEPNWEALIRDCFRHPKDEAVLGRFFEALLHYLTAALLATYTGDREIVRDALQSAFLKYINIFRKAENRDLAIGYFVVVAKNCLIDELRRHKGEIPSMKSRKPNCLMCRHPAKMAAKRG
jgi:hypothetical protein